jgi:tetratricopeptide (TPR) repeat protein
MSFLKRIFGGTSAEDERREGDRLYDAGNSFEARQAYERALSKNKNEPGALRDHCQERLHACSDALAEARMLEAERLRKDGHLDIARGELETAIEIAHSHAVRDRGRRALELLERRDAIEQAAAPTELSEDDRWAVIAGNYSESQLDEYDLYGDEFRTAILALHEGKNETALPVLEKLVDEHGEEAIFLWLEVGRVRVLSGDEEGGAKALRKFLSRTKKASTEGAEDARLGAYLALASLADRQGDEEKAIEWMQKAIDTMPGDPRPYLQLGNYLREKGHPEPAIEVLETAIEIMGEEQPSWEVVQELGLARMDAGHDQQAFDLLERVLKIFVARARLDFPRTTALPLAKLSEKMGKLERAADLYRSLASGSDRENHLEYHREAGRVLVKLELLDEARRMWTRASALAESQPELLAEIEAEIATLDARLR